MSFVLFFEQMKPNASVLFFNDSILILTHLLIISISDFRLLKHSNFKQLGQKTITMYTLRRDVCLFLALGYGRTAKFYNFLGGSLQILAISRFWPCPRSSSGWRALSAFKLQKFRNFQNFSRNYRQIEKYLGVLTP